MKEITLYTEALALEELGFDEPCFGFFNIKKVFIPDFGVIGIDLRRLNIKECCLAPTYSQAFRWFREKYRLLHSITGIHSTEPFELDCQILNISNGNTWVLSYRGDAYEEAELACLRKLIEIVKNK